MALPKRLRGRGLFSRLAPPAKLPGVLSATEFEAAFVRERARVDRYGCRFALVIFGPFEGEDAEPSLMADILRNRVRVPDYLGRLDHERLAVLLPETGTNGARTFTESLLEQASRAGIKTNYVVYAYPLVDDDPSPNGNGRNGKGRSHHEDDSGSNGNGSNDLDVSRELEGDSVAIAERWPEDLDYSEVRADSTHPVIDLSSCFDEPLPVWKRGLDIVVAGTMLLLLAPLFLVVAAAIKLTSRGPVLFRQLRAGVGGKPFTFYKFRSMFVDAERQKDLLSAQNEQEGPIFKIKADPRMTPLGRFLRKTSIDELPQLWNVLKGDMTLVGPRPPTMDEIGSYERWQWRRLSLKGGLTCIWQVSGRSEVGFEDWMRMDVRYAQTHGFLGDLKLLSKTLRAVISGRGAY